VLVAARGASYTDGCSYLWSFASSPDSRNPRRLAEFMHSEAGSSYGGDVGNMVFSPDGGRIAVLSNHKNGCSSYQGGRFCEDLLYTLRADGTGLHNISTHPFDGADIVWLP
jgi:hypothetical protein